MKKNKHFFGFNKKKLGRWFLYWLVLGAGLFILLFLVTTTLIGVEVKGRCLAAQGKYQGDCIEALVKTLEDKGNSFRERNYAIWSLGQLGEKKALSVLETFYTGNISSRESYDDGLSQYELRKAINLIKSGINLSAPVWR